MIGDYACYSRALVLPDPRGGLQGADEWDACEGGEPEGWHKHPASGRIRTDCDPAKEWIRTTRTPLWCGCADGRS